MTKRSLQVLLAILFLAGTARADEPIRIGDWLVNVNDSNTAIFAATENGAGSVFGQYCFPERQGCMYLLGLRTSCENGSEYPVLANSDSGAYPLTLRCFGANDTGVYEYAVTNFDLIDAAVRQSTRIGFAIPMQSDAFRVVRFSLIGAVKAMDGVRTAAEEIAAEKGAPRGDFRPAEETL